MEILSQLYSIDVTLRGKNHFGKGWRDFQSKKQHYLEIKQKITNTPLGYPFLICGAISGNFYCIDVDTKHWVGIDELFLKQVKLECPELFEKLNINETPSGGLHIYYLVDEIKDPERFKCKKIATKEGQTEAGLESRGEGGLIIIPPAKGYKEIKGNLREPPLITWEEHILLDEIAMSFNEVKEEPKKRPEKLPDTKPNNNVNFYEQSPFEQFNNSNEVPYFIEEYGWTFESEDSEYVRFTRPGKDSGVSISFIKNVKRFYVFTSSTNLTPSTPNGENTYSACDIILYHVLPTGSDNKTLLRWLNSRGYKGVRNAKYSEISIQMPQGGIIEKVEQKPEENVGAVGFIDEGSRGKLFVNLEKFKWFCEENNFYWASEKQTVVHVIDNCIYSIDTIEFQNRVHALCVTGDAEHDAIYLHELEMFMKTYIKYISSRLPILDENKILKDGRYVCYKLYINYAIKITKGGIEKLKYDDDRIKDMYYWNEDRIDRNFREYNYKVFSKEENVFVDFINKAILNIDHFEYVWGYLAHKHFTGANAYLTVLLEAVESSKDGGGSGKNVLIDLLKLTNTVHMKDHPDDAKYNSQYFQSWNGENIIAISDVPEDFKYNSLKETTTGTVTIKKLWQNEGTFINAFKTVVLTNYSYSDADRPMKRRIRPIEFTDYFSLAGGVDTHYDGKYFPDDWQEADFAGFDNFTHNCIQKMLLNGGKVPLRELSDTGKLKQFQTVHGAHASSFVIEKWDELKSIAKENDGYIPTPAISFMFNIYADDFQIQDRYRPSGMRLNDAVVGYAEILGLEAVKSKARHLPVYSPNGSLSTRTTQRCIYIDLKEDDFLDINNPESEKYVPF